MVRPRTKRRGKQAHHGCDSKPVILSLSKDDHPHPWFDKLTMTAIRNLSS